MLRLIASSSNLPRKKILNECKQYSISVHPSNIFVHPSDKASKIQRPCQLSIDFNDHYGLLHQNR